MPPRVKGSKGSVDDRWKSVQVPESVYIDSLKSGSSYRECYAKYSVRLSDRGRDIKTCCQKDILELFQEDVTANLKLAAAEQKAPGSFWQIHSKLKKCLKVFH